MSAWDITVSVWNYVLHLIGKSILYLTPIAWPLIIFVIVLLFRKPLAVLIPKLKGVKGFGLDVVTQDVDDRRLADEFTGSVRDVMPSGELDGVYEM